MEFVLCLVLVHVLLTVMTMGLASVSVTQDTTGKTESAFKELLVHPKVPEILKEFVFVLQDLQSTETIVQDVP